MAPDTIETATGRRPKTQYTVFDLDKFEEVKLAKFYDYPAEPKTVAEALAFVGNDEAKLLRVIYDGMKSEANTQARNSADGWTVADESGLPTDEAYTGSFADEKLGKLIDAAILNLAKMTGYDKSLPAAQREQIREDAKSYLRANPKVIEHLKSKAASTAA